MLWVYIIASIICYSGLSTMYKIGSLKKCHPAAFVCLSWLTALICTLWILMHTPERPHAPGTLLIIGAASGVCGALCMVCMFHALKHGGKLSVINTLVGLSVIMPIVFSVVFLHESLSARNTLGLLCFAVFVALINMSERKECA